MQEPGELNAVRVDRDETQVMFLRTEDKPAEMRKGWEQLERLVGLRGRKFFGTFYRRLDEIDLFLPVA